jgi:hypothetical protein
VLQQFQYRSYVASNGTMNVELGKDFETSGRGLNTVLPWPLTGGSEETHEKP